MKNNTVCVLGNGQLGRMLKQAGEPLGIHVFPVGIDSDPSSIPYQNSIITAEIERWPETNFTQQLASHPYFINQTIFPIIADRLTQKQLMDELGLPTAKWMLLEQGINLSVLLDALGDVLIIKRRVGGYDGRGLFRVESKHKADLPNELYSHAIVEQAIEFDEEVSLIGARDHQGQSVFYPLTHNFHENGILKASIVKPYYQSTLQKKAESMLSIIMDKLNYVGVMAMECFVQGDVLLINELAPRVHNSGHWTQNGASVSQFELHLRAILGLPIHQPEVFAHSVMINLIGIDRNLDWLGINLINLHWYEKAVRAGRKVGHLNASHIEPKQLMICLDKISKLLPSNAYAKAVQWAKHQLL